MASKSTFKSAQGGTLSSLGGPKATDFDAILLEGLQALAKRVQEHHEYLQAQHAPPHNGRGDPPTPSHEPNRNFKLPVLEEEQEVGGADGPSPPGVAQTLCDIVPSSPAPSIKEDRPKPVKLNFDLHSRWKTLDALRSQDSSVAVAAALYQQDEGESIEGSDSEKSNCEDSRKPGTLQRCVKRVNTCMTPWMISPNSVVRSCWDSLACIFVIYECIMIPLAFFDFGESAFLDVVGWIVRIFWSVDFPLSCFTGYALPGEMVEMRPKKVFPHYAKTWMSLDVSMLCVDWAEVIIGGGGMGSLNAARMGKTVKSLRMIRMMRLWRLLNVNRLPESVKVLIHHYFQSEVSRIVLDICKILLFLVWINHVLACCWYGIADSMTLEDGSWLQKERFQDQEFAFLYMTCFHWSLTQFAGSTDVYPVSVYERTFAVCALVFCFIISASIVSSITTSMTRLSIARSKETTKLAALKEYLREHHISSRTALRVQRNAQYALEEQKRHTPEEDIELLAFLSEPLRVELRYEISMPALRRHGFFQTLDQENPAVARQMCYKALGSMMIHKAEILFVQGVEQVNQMYLFTDGKLSYFRDSSVGIHTKASSQRTNIVRKKDKITIGNGDWACDAALWTAWTTCGTVRAKTQCTVLTLTAEDFHNIVSQYKDVVPSLQSFGRRFVKYLNSKEPSDLTDLNDVECDLGEMAREAFRDLEQETHKPSGLSLKRGASLNNFFTRPVTSEERPKWLNSLMGRIERTRANRGGRTSSSGSSSTPTSARVAESKPDSESDPVVMH